MSQTKVFADGFSFKRRAGAPDFVVGNLNVKEDEAIAFIKKYAKNGWVNLDILIGKTGKHYVELNQWEPETNNTQTVKQVNPVAQDDDLPF